jgi:hypothetical protein
VQRGVEIARDLTNAICVYEAEWFEFEKSHPTENVAEYGVYRRPRRHLVTISGRRLPDLHSLDPDDRTINQLSTSARQTLEAERERYALAILVMFCPFRHPNLSNDRHEHSVAAVAPPAPAPALSVSALSHHSAAHSAQASVSSPPDATPSSSAALLSYWAIYLKRISDIRKCPVAARIIDNIQQFYEDVHENTDNQPLASTEEELLYVSAVA